ncbi:MAG: hypothetical protein Ct9H90mP8_2270 [Pseudomonadota bacterium]|nr:MAG: hypothetical protein Ct9H90mP8_2270 [Pseudomonadota bacterium]
MIETDVGFLPIQRNSTRFLNSTANQGTATFYVALQKIDSQKTALHFFLLLKTGLLIQSSQIGLCTMVPKKLRNQLEQVF